MTTNGIQRKLTLAHGAMAAIVVVFGALISWFIYAVEQEFENLTENTLNIQNALQDMRHGGLRVVASTNEFILIAFVGERVPEAQTAEEQQERNETREGIALFEEGLARYTRVTDVFASDRVSYRQEIERSATALIDESERLIDLSGSGLLPGRLLDEKEDFEALEQAFLSTVDAALGHQLALFNSEKEKLFQSILLVLASTFAGFCMAAALVIIIGRFVTRDMTIPLKKLLHTSNAIADGDLSARSNLVRDDEIGQLGRAFDNMVDDLNRTIASKEQAEQSATTAMYEARAANETKSFFLANMSHELRTPLNSIIGFSYVIEAQSFGAITEPKYVEYASKIHQSGNHLLGIINDLLDVSIIEAGGAELENAPICLNTIVDESIDLVRVAAETAGVIIEKESTDDLPMFIGDELRIRQALVNLLNNAIKFTLPGGRVVVGAKLTDSGEFGLSVRDTGIGIDKEDIPKVLLAFGQVEQAKTRSNNGVGLGLTLVKKLTELHDGELTIESEVGVGTAVELKFPASRLAT